MGKPLSDVPSERGFVVGERFCLWCLQGGNGEGKVAAAQGQGGGNGAEYNALSQCLFAAGNSVHALQIFRLREQRAFDFNGIERLAGFLQNIHFSPIAFTEKVQPRLLPAVAEPPHQLSEHPTFRNMPAQPPVFRRFLRRFDVCQPSAEPRVHEVNDGGLGEPLVCSGAVRAQQRDDA